MADLINELAGKVAIVTGSARNIGRATALELARAGAAVVVNARQSAQLCDEVVGVVTDAGGCAIPAVADITDPAAVNRMVLGWYPRGDILNSKCIVLFGHDPRRHSWTLEYKSIRMAQANGAKLIVLDPRKSGNAEAADIWLPLRAGTDAAMTFGWLNVILEEELYDKDFVRDWTVGFDPRAARRLYR